MDIEGLAKKNPLIFVVSGVLVILAAIPSVYFYLQYQKVQEKLKNPQVYSQEEVQKLVERVSKLMELPEGETPTIATVTESEKLKDQPFFAKSQNGDKVLIFTNAKKAILFRPETNKIIEVAPINLGQSASASAIPQDAQPVTTVVIRNGTQTVGLTKTIEDTLKQKIPTITVVDRENAKNRNYTSTLVIDVKGTKSSFADDIAKALQATVGQLPKDEATPSADFLVIVGSDKK